MAIQKLTADEAIARIRLCTATGGQVLGVDGIQITAEGSIGRLDLILDLSSQAITPEAAEQEAISFVGAHSANDIMFDVVTGQSDEVT